MPKRGLRLNADILYYTKKGYIFKVLGENI